MIEPGVIEPALWTVAAVVGGLVAGALCLARRVSRLALRVSRLERAVRRWERLERGEQE